jgi:hypothetical protein
MTTVKRRCSIMALDRTAAAIERARKTVGAPEKAKFRFGDYYSMNGELVVENVEEPNPIQVEFYWNEEVPYE